MQKIKSTSHMLYLFFRALCWILPVVTAYLILFNLEKIIGWGAWASMIPSVYISAKYSEVSTALGTNALHYFSMYHRLLILGIQMIPLSITVLIFMIVGELLQLIYQPLMTAALTFNNPPGERFASITLGTTNASTLITAFLILVVSWIIKEAHQLKSDSQLTI